jgi:hypothetical protein
MTDLTAKETENCHNALRAARREEQMKCRVTGTTFRRGDGRFVSADGIARLAEAGVASFEGATGHYLPHNLIRTAMSGAVGVVGSRGCVLSQEGAAHQIESHARMSGWLAAAAKLPAVLKLIEKTQSRRGINSDYTHLSLWNLVERFPSPGHLERKLWLVKRRAEAILGAYERQKPSWRSLGEAIMADARVGKAAIIAVATNLGWDGEEGYQPSVIKNGEIISRSRCLGLAARAKGHGKLSSAYQKARGWIAEHRSAAFPVVRKDGVQTTDAPIYTKMGAEVYGALRIGEYGQRKLLYFVRFGERELIVEDKEARLRSPSTGYWTTVVHGPRAAILNALSAWKTHERETIPVMQECEHLSEAERIALIS